MYHYSKKIRIAGAWLLALMLPGCMNNEEVEPSADGEVSQMLWQTDGGGDLAFSAKPSAKGHFAISVTRRLFQTSHLQFDLSPGQMDSLHTALPGVFAGHFKKAPDNSGADTTKLAGSWTQVFLVFNAKNGQDTVAIDPLASGLGNLNLWVTKQCERALPETTTHPYASFFGINGDTNITEANFRAKLKKYREQWQAHKPPRYRLYSEVSGFEYGSTQGLLTVEGNQRISSLVPLKDSAQVRPIAEYPTLDQLFATYLDTPEGSLGPVRLSTDEKLGYITRVATPPQFEDGTIRFFSIVDTAKSPYVHPQTPSDKDKERLIYQRAYYRRHPILNYSYTLELNCFCAFRFAKVIASNGKTIHFTPENQKDMPEIGSSYALDSLFSQVETALSYAEHTVDYDPVFGYPRHIAWDMGAMIADGGMEMWVKSLQIINL